MFSSKIAPWLIRLTHRRPGRRPPFEYIALLLQGGGALGAYQGGVYEGLCHDTFK